MTAASTYVIRPATRADAAPIAALLPRLADFELPAHRRSEHAWHSDRDIVASWERGERTDVQVSVAVDADDTIVGATVASLREELLNHEPSAHLEVVVVAPGAEGRGLGRRLIEAAEARVRQAGARSMTLHVFATNHRARRLYERMGYDGEVIRYFKTL